jgi:hypothetical protein
VTAQLQLINIIIIIIITIIIYIPAVQMNLYSDRRHLKLQLGYSDSKLQLKGKTVKYRNDFFRRAERTYRLLTIRTCVIGEKVELNFGENVKQYVGMVWVCSTHGG